jgi:uncharacterized membrane protein
MIQTMLSQIGQSLCFFPYVICMGCLANKPDFFKDDKNKKVCPWYLPVIPGLLDVISSMMAYIALNLISSSVWQISRGGNIVTTAILSKLFLKKTFNCNSILGCLLALTGITAVQIFEITLTDKSHERVFTTGEQILGVILLFLSIIFNSGTLVI